MFNEKGEFIRSFGQNRVNKPTGIGIDNEGRTFVVSKGNNKILLFNPNGEFVSVVNKSGSLKDPRGISLDSQRNLIVCDSGNKCVKILSPDGKVFKTVGRGRLRKPFDCLCYEDKIFVSDTTARLIKVYRNNGKFLYEFGRYGTGHGEFDFPAGIAIDKTGHLLVTDAQQVQVFTLDGTFITTFGDALFKDPCGVSVLKDGKIVVVDFRGDRLKSFE